MREIKFRTWTYWKGTPKTFEVKLIDFEQGKIYFDCIKDFDDYYSRDFSKLEQYTGLKDKNGKEIYEGDVLDHPMQGKRVVYYPFNERVASYGLREISTGMSSTLQDSHRVYEIIGNIHENPELLEVLHETL